MDEADEDSGVGGLMLSGLRRSSFGAGSRTGQTIRGNSSASPSFSENKIHRPVYPSYPRRPSFVSPSTVSEEHAVSDFASLPRRRSTQLFGSSSSSSSPSTLTRHHSLVDRGGAQGGRPSPFSLARTNSDVGWDQRSSSRFRSFRERSPKLHETDVEEAVSFFFLLAFVCTVDLPPNLIVLDHLLVTSYIPPYHLNLD
jgi:hypothetical protein